jgi:hypothetical protein
VVFSQANAVPRSPPSTDFRVSRSHLISPLDGILDISTHEMYRRVRRPPRRHGHGFEVRRHLGEMDSLARDAGSHPCQRSSPIMIPKSSGPSASTSHVRNVFSSSVSMSAPADLFKLEIHTSKWHHVLIIDSLQGLTSPLTIVGRYISSLSPSID